MFDRRLIQNFDWVLLGLVVIICATGIVNLYSAGYNRGEGTPLYIKQLYWLAVGLGVMCVTLTYDYRHLEKLSYPIYILSILLLVAVMFGGKMVSGSRRWLPLGPLAFQPAELAKIGIILALAAYFNRRTRTEAMGLKELIVPGVLVMIPVALIIKQPDLGSGILVALVAGSIILFVGVRWRTLMGCGLTLLMLSPVLWHFLKDYQRQRVLTFLDPGRDPLGAGYHILQSMIAVGSGQFWGKGFLAGHPEPALFSPGAAHRFRLFGVCRGVGLCGLGGAAAAVYGPGPLGAVGGPGLQGALRPPAGRGGDGPDLLADIHQPLHGHRLFAGGGYPPAPVQLRRFLPDHHLVGGGISPEYPHAKILIRGVIIFLQKNFDSARKIG